MRRALLAAIALPLLLAQGCAADGGGTVGGDGVGGGAAAGGAGAGGSAGATGRYKASGMVLEAKGGPQLCLGAVMDSYPPQCDGIPVSGWRWEDVEGETSSNGTTWGSFDVVGTYDGETFTLESAGPQRLRATGPEERIDSPCQEPAGGWAVPDAARAGEDDLEPVSSAVRSQPDFAGLWISYLEPMGANTAEDPGEFVLNVAFTGDLARHEAELRSRWGGRLCVAERPRSFADLTRIQEELHGAVGNELGLEVYSSGISEYRNVVTLGVLVLDEADRAALDERYGKGVLDVEAAMAPAG